MNLADLENKIILADCMDILKQIETKRVDLVLTDPPYGMEIKRCGGVLSKYQKDKNAYFDWDIATKKEVFDEMFSIFYPSDC